MHFSRIAISLAAASLALAAPFEAPGAPDATEEILALVGYLKGNSTSLVTSIKAHDLENTLSTESGINYDAQNLKELIDTDADNFSDEEVGKVVAAAHDAIPNFQEALSTLDGLRPEVEAKFPFAIPLVNNAMSDLKAHMDEVFDSAVACGGAPDDVATLKKDRAVIDTAFTKTLDTFPADFKVPEGFVEPDLGNLGNAYY